MVIVYALAIASVIVRINGGALYLFGNRYDVVLSNSMATKNEKHLDFLEGTTQFQKNDIIVSSKVEENTEINVKDVILFLNQDYNNNLTAHRVVNIIEEGILFTINSTEQVEFSATKCIKLKNVDSLITLVGSKVTKVEFEYYSAQEYEEIFYVKFEEYKYTPVNETEKIGDYYLHKCVVNRSKPFTANTYLGFNEFEDAYIKNISYTLDDGKMYTFAGDELITKDDNFQKRFDYKVFYETRGDAASSSETHPVPRDGVIAKVHSIIPGIGVVVRFITSIYGIILLIGIGIVITLNSFLIDKYLSKKENDTPDQIESVEEKEGKDEEKVEDTNK